VTAVAAMRESTKPISASLLQAADEVRRAASLPAATLHITRFSSSDVAPLGGPPRPPELWQPVGTDFVAELKNKFIENFTDSLNTTTKIKLETYTTIRSGGFLMPPSLEGKNREMRKMRRKI
jgi:hypothetical protein